MPVPAARLADVVAGDSYPLVLGGRRKHAPQQLAIAGLQLTLPLEGLTRSGDPIGERIANALELFEASHSRLAKTGRDASLKIESRKGLDREAGELVLEASDLTAQLSACEALVASHAKPSKRVSVEQIRHKLESSVNHCAVRENENLVKEARPEIKPRGPHRRSRAPRRPMPVARP